MHIIETIQAELARATAKFPTWPTDPLHALAVLGEEFGELNKAMLQLVYEPHKASKEEVRTEAIQTAAMALRLAMSLDRYEYLPGPQHEQEKPEPAGGEYMQTIIHVDRLTNEQARQWLIDNDREAVDFWSNVESSDLRLAVCDSLRDYRGDQNGNLHVLLTDDACRRLYAAPASGG